MTNLVKQCRGRGGQHGEGPTRDEKLIIYNKGTEGGGELDGCIMHQVHTSLIKFTNTLWRQAFFIFQKAHHET
jgi:hypothetical protein